MFTGYSDQESHLLRYTPRTNVYTEPQRTNQERTTYYEKGGKKHDKKNNNMIFTSPEGKFEFEVDKFKEWLDHLKPYASTLINDLPKHIRMELDMVTEIFASSNKNPTAHERILEIIKDKFNDMSGFRTDTVGSFFVGCYTKNNFPGKPECDFKCVAALASSNSAIKCDEEVLIRRGDGKFESMNSRANTNTNHAYILVRDKEFKHFTDDDISKLKSMGIHFVTVVISDPDNKDKYIMRSENRISVSNLKNFKLIIIADNGETQLSGESSTNNNTTAIVVGVVIGVIVLILIILAIYYMGGSGGSRRRR